MGRIYSAAFVEIAVSASSDLFQLEAVTKGAIIHAIYLGQTSDFGDATAEIVSMQIARITDDVTAGVTEANLDLGDNAATADVAINQTSQLTTGYDPIHADAWNVALPYVYLPPPELRIVVEIGNAIVLDMEAPADELTMSGTIYWEETGS